MSAYDKLWAPWRLDYITGKAKSDDCVFCEAPGRSEDGHENLILHRGKFAYIIMNLFPYNNGHSMVVPFRHLSDFSDLTDAEMLEIMQLSGVLMRACSASMNCQGFNTGFNLGRAAGAGIAQHLHYHVVPRWVGDANFMPVVSETKVISEHIRSTYDKLSKAIQEELDK